MMFKLVLHLFLIKLTMTLDSGEDILETLNLIPPALRTSKNEVDTLDAASKNLEDTNSRKFDDMLPRVVDYSPHVVFAAQPFTQRDLCFNSYSPLRNYHTNAIPVAPSKYPWIADVVHSRSGDVPHACTASCIEDGIFITAAACIYSLKIKHTTLLYMSLRLVVRAFVLPSVPTKQMFDDIGIIVVDAKKVKGVKWAHINLFTAVKRTDRLFHWFANIDKNYGKINYRVIAYAIKKEIHRFAKPEEQFTLFELDVIAEPDICFKVLQRNDDIKHEGYRVPCYHTCPFKDYFNEKAACRNRFLGVEGGAIIDTISNKLIGVATWGGGAVNATELPVGFSFANSETFYKDLACAKWIRDDNGQLDTKGYYQSLCDKNNK